MKIRAATPSDASELTILAQRAKASWGYPESWLSYWQRELVITPEYIRAENHVFVVEVDDRTAGFTSLVNGETGHEIDHFWISPESQRQGFGNALLEYSLQHARALGWTSVRILSDPNARPFYERAGAVFLRMIDKPIENEPRQLPLLLIRL